MKATIKSQTSTKTVIDVVPTEEYLDKVKNKVAKRLGKDVKLAGFRPGKAPVEEIIKNIDPNLLNEEFINDAVNGLVPDIIKDNKLTAVVAPHIELTKYVPFVTLDFTVTIASIGKVTLADYKKMKFDKPDVAVSEEETNGVLKRIQMDLSEKTEVKRASKDGDQVWIDFDGVDAKGAKIDGAKGEDYPLALGSNTFIPGFEENLVGKKAGDEAKFDITFPKDYQAKHLQGVKATFTCQVKKVQSVTIPKVDDELAKKAGPYKDLKELKDYIASQSNSEKAYQAQLDLESTIVKKIAEESKVEIPDELTDLQIDRIITDHKQNLVHSGTEYKDWLKENKMTEEEHKEKTRPDALERIKGGVILSEIAKEEKISYDDTDIEAYMTKYSQQFNGDPKMLEQLKTESGRRDIAARILTDKTVEFLRSTLVKN